MLCWGWIDGVRKGLDARSYLQRYSPRSRRSVWSQINVENVARLIREGRMTAHGLKQVDAAKADGRRDRAYGRGRDMAAIDAVPRARAMLATLRAFRVHTLKAEAGRKRKIAALVAMLERGGTTWPQGITPRGAHR